MLGLSGMEASDIIDDHIRDVRITNDALDTRLSIDVSENHDGSVRIWFRDGTIFLHSQKDSAFLNPDSSEMFRGMQSLTSIDMSGYDASLLQDASGMFSCTGISRIDLRFLRTATHLEILNGLVSECAHLQELDLSPVPTKDVWDISCLCSGYTALEKLILMGCSLENITETGDMLYGCGDVQIFAGPEYMNLLFSGTNLLDFRRVHRP